MPDYASGFPYRSPQKAVEIRDQARTFRPFNAAVYTQNLPTTPAALPYGAAVSAVGAAGAVIQVINCGGNTITVEASVDGINWPSLPVASLSTGQLSTSITQDGLYVVATVACAWLRTSIYNSVNLQTAVITNLVSILPALPSIAQPVQLVDALDSQPLGADPRPLSVRDKVEERLLEQSYELAQEAQFTSSQQTRGQERVPLLDRRGNHDRGNSW